jgi:hypothetical protein
LFNNALLAFERSFQAHDIIARLVRNTICAKTATRIQLQIEVPVDTSCGLLQLKRIAIKTMAGVEACPKRSDEKDNVTSSYTFS